MKAGMSGMINEELLYDAFISYHEKDIEWVSESLITLLEEEGIKVCWDHQDFEPGKTLLENKLNAICSSATTVIILSPDYVRDENLWDEICEHCGWDDGEIIKEFCLIPVVYRASEIPDILKPLWKLDWTNKATQKFFWRKLVQSIKKQKAYRSAHGNPKPFGKNGFTQDSKYKESNSASRTHGEARLSAPEDAQLIHKLKKSEIADEHRGEVLKDNAMKKSDGNHPLLKSCSKAVDDEDRGKDMDGGYNDEGINIEWKETHNQKTKLADNRINENCGRDLMNRDVTEGKHSANSESDNLKIDNRGRITVPNGTEDLEEGEDANKTKLMESMSPRILSFFVPEDDDLTRKDVEELTFKIENVYAEEAKTISEEKALNNVNGHHEGYRRGIAKNLSFGNERFSLAQEQMRYLDYLQEMEVWIKMKFEKCHDCSRKRIYRRLLERSDRAIFSTVNGFKDSDLLANLPLPDLLHDESRGHYCSCCDQLFHSGRALDMHMEQCVKTTWMDILKMEIGKQWR